MTLQEHKAIEPYIGEAAYNIYREYVRRNISESVQDKAHEINEANGNNTKRKAVMNMLNDGKFDHAYLAYQLWHPKDDGEKDTYRSLFSKKFTGKPDNDGAVRSFSDDEVNKLYELMRGRN